MADDSWKNISQEERTGLTNFPSPLAKWLSLCKTTGSMFLSINDIRELVKLETQIMMEEGRLHLEKEFIQHGNTSVFKHSVSVACLSGFIGYLCAFIVPVNLHSLIRGSLLHDYFLYDWHTHKVCPRWHGFKHPKIALKNAMEDFDLNETEKDMIKNHMFPLTLRPPRYFEGWIICVADKISTVWEVIKGKTSR